MDDAPTEQDHIDAARDAVLEALPGHVVFDGWSRMALEAAIEEAGVDPGLVRLAFPRGALDAARAHHLREDDRLYARLAAEAGSGRIRDRITNALRWRLEAMTDNKEAVRRAAAYFALPHMSVEGARLIWNTADVVWRGIGDTSDDLNWYTKRATLSGVYSATLLYWLGDASEGAERTWAFLDRIRAPGARGAGVGLPGGRAR